MWVNINNVSILENNYPMGDAVPPHEDDDEDIFVKNDRDNSDKINPGRLIGNWYN